MVERELIGRKEKLNGGGPNFESLVGRVKLGDEDASSELAQYLRSRFLPYFSTRFAEEAEDLTQSTLYKIFGNLGRFAPKNEKDPFSSQFLGWCFTIGKHALYDEVARKKREAVSKRYDHWGQNKRPSATSLSQSEDNTPQPQTEALKLMLKDKLAEMLPEHLRKIAELAVQNKSIPEIAAEVKYTQGAVRTSLWQARKIIDEKLIFPAGYKRVTVFSRDVVDAVRAGRMDGVKFMHMWYTTDEAVKQYQLTKEVPDQTLLDNGYVLISKSVSEAEEISLIRFQPDLLRLHRGIYYIRQESLEEFRQKRLKRARKAKPDSCKYHKLSEFAKTASEQLRLSRAVRMGKLEAIKESGMWLVTQEAIDEFQKQGSA